MTQSEAWIDPFLREGYTQFPRLVPEPLIETARRSILRDLRENYDEKRLVEYNHQSWCPGLRRSPEILALFETHEVRSIANLLSAKAAIKAATSPKLLFAKHAVLRRPPHPSRTLTAFPHRTTASLVPIFGISLCSLASS